MSETRTKGCMKEWGLEMSPLGQTSQVRILVLGGVNLQEDLLCLSSHPSPPPSPSFQWLRTSSFNNRKVKGQTRTSIKRPDTGMSALLSLGGGVTKCECVINALCLSYLRFSLVCVQEQTWGHYSCSCLDNRLIVSVLRSKRKSASIVILVHKEAF